LAAAEDWLAWANHTLDQLHQHTSPDVDRYHHARQQVDQLSDEFRHHARWELLDRYATTDRIPELNERLDALDTWWRFAKATRSTSTCSHLWSTSSAQSMATICRTAAGPLTSSTATPSAFTSPPANLRCLASNHPALMSGGDDDRRRRAFLML
jgi:hypothetical protein